MECLESLVLIFCQQTFFFLFYSLIVSLMRRRMYGVSANNMLNKRVFFYALDPSPFAVSFFLYFLYNYK